MANDTIIAGQVNAATFFGEVGLFGVLNADNIELGQVLQLSSLTTTERDALTAVNGMIIYNSTTNRFQGYENGAWENLREAVLG